MFEKRSLSQLPCTFDEAMNSFKVQLSPDSAKMYFFCKDFKLDGACSVIYRHPWKLSVSV